MLEPRYCIPAGLHLITAHSSRAIYPQGDGTYRLEDHETGQVEILCYRELLRRLRMPDVSSANGLLQTNSAMARIHSGGLYYRESLSPRLNDQIDFREALCFGIDALAAQGVEIYPANLNKSRNRQVIRAVASQFYTKTPIGFAFRGGSTKVVAIVPSGRILFKYWKRFKESGQNQMALPDQWWRRGNRSDHGVSTRMRELMTIAIETVYFDKRKPSVSKALEFLKNLVQDENALRQKDGLTPLKLVSHKTLGSHITKIDSTARTIAREGERSAANNRSRGASDTPALMIGELVEIDECKLSLITSAQKYGWWEALDSGQKEALEEIELIVRARLLLLVMIDVATRMPLAWVLTDAPSHEATLQLIRMATRSKVREKITHGCESDPMPAVGIGMAKNDNGTGIRNAPVKTAVLGFGAEVVDMRAYLGVEKPHVERMFGTLERGPLQLIHGYTGSRPGALPGYDPVANGVINTGELYGIITRYFVDVYPNEQHFGINMFGARPAARARQINEDYGIVNEVSAHDRRIHLGWSRYATVTDEGVKVFGLPFNSAELQSVKDSLTGKVKVFIDPDDIKHSTVLIEGHSKPILANLTWTEMQDQTLGEFFEIARAARAEDPAETELNEERLARARRNLGDQMHEIARKHNLPRSYMTIAEAEAKAKLLITGQHSHLRSPSPGAATPGTIAGDGPVAGIRMIGSGPIHNPEATPLPSGGGFLSKPDVKGKLT